MKKDFDNYEILSYRWADLSSEVIVERKFDREEFIILFKKTHEKIKKFSIAPNIDRDVMDLVFSISGFVATRPMHINNEHTAATELTEAMIHCCLYEEAHEDVISKCEWYLFSEIILDFTKPEEMIFNISADLEQWDSIATQRVEI